MHLLHHIEMECLCQTEFLIYESRFKLNESLMTKKTRLVIITAMICLKIMFCVQIAAIFSVKSPCWKQFITMICCLLICKTIKTHRKMWLFMFPDFTA